MRPYVHCTLYNVHVDLIGRKREVKCRPFRCFLLCVGGPCIHKRANGNDIHCLCSVTIKVITIGEGWGAEFVQFLGALAVFPQSIWKNRRNSTVSSKPTKAKQLARQGIEQNLLPRQMQRPLPCLLSPSFFYGNYSLAEAVSVFIS